MEFRVWLANPWKLWYNWPLLVEEVEALFAPAIEKSSKYSSLKVQNTKVVPAAKDRDVVVYVVPTYEHGFVGRGFGPPGSDADRETGGLTLPYGGFTCSEVYVGNFPVATGGVELKVEAMTSGVVKIDAKRPPELLARVIYHEALHNKTGKGNHALHSKDKKGLGQKEIGQWTPLTSENTAMMAGALGKERPQWLDGWAELASR